MFSLDLLGTWSSFHPFVSVFGANLLHLFRCSFSSVSVQFHVLKIPQNTIYKLNNYNTTLLHLSLVDRGVVCLKIVRRWKDQAEGLMMAYVCVLKQVCGIF